MFIAKLRKRHEFCQRGLGGSVQIFGNRVGGATWIFFIELRERLGFSQQG